MLSGFIFSVSVSVKVLVRSEAFFIALFEHWVGWWGFQALLVAEKGGWVWISVRI
jgi:hypothetical protein